ncbi:hypothetical protein [Phormidium sp. FACHB-1136]|uniref:WD40 domain-containing protein n=1 Tax=Phormidium sp. FACHB-1136 TaxID=2692848 RepID=UPI001686BFA7|nr:hypothetical protein [Phormidium sp. FACHB-1136]MBD2427828.1 hypothetical protein [Phormidium sp. FACHB-1136]
MTNSLSSGASSYATSVKTHRTSPREFYDHAKCLIKIGQYREAAEELTHAIKLNPNYAAAYHLRGILFSVLGFEHRGSSDFRRASEYGLYLIDYDDEIIDLIRHNSEFRYLSYLLKKDSPRQAGKNSPRKEKNQPQPQESGTQEQHSPFDEVDSTKVKEAGFTAKLSLDGEFAQEIEAISVMVMSPNRKLIVTGHHHGSIELWNYKNKRRFHVLNGHLSIVTHLVFSPDNQILFSGSQDGTIRLWNLADGSFIKQIKAHDQDVETFAIDYTAKSLITIGSEGKAKIWDFREGKLLRSFPHPEASTLLLALGTAGLFSICGISDGSIQLCRTLKVEKMKSIQAHSESVQALTISQESRTFASGSSNGEVGLWQFPSGDRRQTCQSAQSGITALTFCHQGRLLCGTDNQGRLMVWDVASGALLDTVFAHSPGNMNLITVADDTLLSAGADGCIRQWRLQVPS